MDIVFKARKGMVIENIPVKTEKTAIVIVDMWNYHWCRTWLGRAGAMVPRMNCVLSVARELGIKIVHAPTDVANSYAGYLQRERMAALPQCRLPHLDLSTWPSEELMNSLPEPPWWEGDMCGGTLKCKPNYGENKIDPSLEIHQDDWISASGQDVYNLCSAFGIENLIYMGGATNICLFKKPEGMLNMSAAGLNCIIARDLTEAHSSGSDSSALDRNTDEVVGYIEKYLGPSVDLVKSFTELGIWKEVWTVDPVLKMPWGLKDYPHYFEDFINVTMSFPHMPEAEIRYTTDGSEPTSLSGIYSGPVRVDGTAVLRSAAFSGGKRVSIESEAHYLRIPKTPPMPDVFLSQMQPLWATVRAQIPWWSHPELGTRQPPVRDRSYDGTPLILREVEYKKGIGVNSPSQMLFDIKPEYGYFVACAGVCESLLKKDLGREIAAFAKVNFKIFIDGKLIAESRTMTISEIPWRFFVKIPDGGRVISLVTTTPSECGSHNLGNWVNAGFLLKKENDM